MLYPQRSLFSILLFSFGILSLFLLTSCQADQADEVNGNTENLSVLPPPSEDYETNPNAWGFIDRSGKMVIADQFDEVRAFSEGLALVRKNGRWGFVNREGEMKISCSHRAAWPFEEGLARVQNDQGLYGVIGNAGQWIIPAKWDDVTSFDEELACIRVGDKYGFLDKKGQVVIDPNFDRSTRFQNGYAVVKKGDKYGMIDKNGKIIIPYEYDRLKPFADGLARASVDKEYGFLNVGGDWVIEPQFIHASDFNDNCATAFDGQKWGLIDNQGNWKKKPIYDQLFWVGKNRWTAEQNGKYQLIDENENVLVDNLDEIHPFTENFAPYRKGELWGYLNRNGQVSTPPIFYLTWPYHNGLARVATEYGLAYIDTEGFFAIPPNPNYFEIHEFNEGLAPVQIYRAN